MKNDFIIVTSEHDLPEAEYDNTHMMYLCITKSGKVCVCKYTELHHHSRPTKWQRAMWDAGKSGTVYSADNIVAYKKITIPENILALCTDKAHRVEYFDQLR